MGWHAAASPPEFAGSGGGHGYVWRRNGENVPPCNRGAQLELKQAVRTCLAKYVTFSGRASRSEFWWFMLSVWVALMLAAVIDTALFGQTVSVASDNSWSWSRHTNFAPLSVVVWLLTVLPSLAVTIRRLHDTDHRGWWLLIAMIPLIGTIILLVWYASKGTEGPNRFGEDPLG